MQGFFEQTIPTYSLDEFKAHLRMERATSEIVTREIMATGNIPTGNPFGRDAIDPNFAFPMVHGESGNHKTCCRPV